jgi:hypothetical protein
MTITSLLKSIHIQPSPVALKVALLVLGLVALAAVVVAVVLILAEAVNENF